MLIISPELLKYDNAEIGDVVRDIDKNRVYYIANMSEKAILLMKMEDYEWEYTGDIDGTFEE